MEVVYLLDGWDGKQLRNLEVAIFELGLRIGLPFRIARSATVVSTAERVVRYSANADEISDAYPHCVNLPCLIRHPEQRKRTYEISPNAFPHHELAFQDGIDLIADVCDLLAFEHEAELREEHFDQLGRIKEGEHPLVRKRLAHVPLIEIAADCLRELLASSFETPLRAPRFWGEYDRVVILTHDCDGPKLHSPFALARSGILSIAKRNSINASSFLVDQRSGERESFLLGLLTLLTGRPDPYWNFANWIDFEKTLPATSTFFFNPGSLDSARSHRHDPRYRIESPRFRAAIDRVNEEGCEAGLHSGINVRSAGAYSESVHRLAEQTNTDVISCRTHYWAYDWKNPYSAWETMSSCGVRNDASLTVRQLGFRNGAGLPISASARWDDLGSNQFLVFPTAMMDQYLVRVARSSVPLADNPDYDALLTWARQRNSLIVLDWHVRTFANVGIWKGYFDVFLEVLEDLSGGGIGILSLAKAGELWRTHIESTYKGRL